MANSLVGGVEAILLNTLKRLDTSKYTATVVVTHMNGPLESEFREYSDEFISIACGPSIKTQGDKENLITRNTQFLLDYTCENKFDILHVINSMEGYHLAEYFKGRIIIGIYGDYHITHNFFERRKSILRIMNRHPRATIISDTPANLDLFSNLIIIPTGVDVPIIREKIERDNKKIIWIGRASGEKRVQLFIEIMQKIPDYNAVMFLVGRISTFKFPPNIKVYHNSTDRELIAREGRSSSIYINTSYIEGQPLSLIEMMICRCIPIVPYLGGMPDLIGNSGTCVHMRKKQNYNSLDINDFVEAIKLYHRMMPATMAKLRRKVKYRVRGHSIEKMANRIFELYEGKK